MQSVISSLASGALEFAGHVWHVVDPTVGQYVPAPHARHSWAPTAAEYVPDVQSVHLEDPAAQHTYTWALVFIHMHVYTYIMDLESDVCEKRTTHCMHRDKQPDILDMQIYNQVQPYVSEGEQVQETRPLQIVCGNGRVPYSIAKLYMFTHVNPTADHSVTALRQVL
jgi:hypothetical protein